MIRFPEFVNKRCQPDDAVLMTHADHRHLADNLRVVGPASGLSFVR
jgi:hypothetical protein